MCFFFFESGELTHPRSAGLDFGFPFFLSLSLSLFDVQWAISCRVHGRECVCGFFLSFPDLAKGIQTRRALVFEFALHQCALDWSMNKHDRGGCLFFSLPRTIEETIEPVKRRRPFSSMTFHLYSTILIRFETHWCVVILVRRWRKPKVGLEISGFEFVMCCDNGARLAFLAG